MPKVFHDYVWEVCFDRAFEARNTWRAAKSTAEPSTMNSGTVHELHVTSVKVHAALG